MTVKTRVAPSPTGDPHVGTAYVALMNQMFARRHGGTFVLRIEDTDRARSTAASEATILRALKWLGLEWDEGPDVGGPNGPYRQSERGEIYAEHTEKLLAAGGAFKCFCTPERLDALREEQRAKGDQPRYDGHCRHLSEAEIAAKEAAGTPHVVRLVVPDEGVCQFEDMARGTVEIAWSTVDMQVLTKSDGFPTYHLANVVDDHLMGITHVMRGEEWIPSAPKHQLLYKYFGWEMPKLMHLPLLRNPDKSKLSKRKNPTSVLYYERMGYLPEAVVNFLGLFGLSQADGEEKMPLDAMTAAFDVSNISLGGPVFDMEKLNWLNGRYVREMPVEAFARAASTWAVNEPYLARVAALAQSRTTLLSDLGQATSFLFAGRLGIAEPALLDGKLGKDAVRRVHQFLQFALDGIDDWTSEAIQDALRRVADAAGVKFRDMMRHVYVAITGQSVSLPLFDSMELLGRDICRERLREAIATLGGVSNKEQKAWRGEWDKAAASAGEGAGNGMNEAETA